MWYYLVCVGMGTTSNKSDLQSVWSGDTEVRWYYAQPDLQVIPGSCSKAASVICLNKYAYINIIKAYVQEYP